MKIAVAQIKPLKANISANIKRHLVFVEIAASLQVSGIFFPELSLTGYEPSLAKELAMQLEDSRLDILQIVADANNITIAVGAPLSQGEGVVIGMLIFQPGKPRHYYAKQLLHDDELPFFTNGQQQVLIEIDQYIIAPAICYESLQPEHAATAIDMGAEIYLASVAKAISGVKKGYAHYPAIASKFSVPVLMANGIGFMDDFESFGTTSVWSSQGKLVGQLSSDKEGMLIFDTEIQTVQEVNM